MVRSPLFWSCVVLGALGCEAKGDEAPGAVPSTAPKANPIPVATPDEVIQSGERVPRTVTESSEDEGPDPSAASDLRAALSRLAQRYSGGWIAASPAFEGELGSGQVQDYQLVLGSAHCYRVLGAADASLEDLDLLLFDPSGVQVQQDQGTDRFPVVGLSYPVCPPSPGAYRLQVQAREGSGKFRVQAFHTP